MKPRTLLLLLPALIALFAAATWLVVKLTEPPPAATPVAAAPQPDPDPQGPPPPAPEVSALTPPEVKDPEEARRLELLIEQRNTFRSLRDGFKGPSAAAPQARLEPALRALWPGQPPPWQIACRGRVCRLKGPGEPAAWHAALLAAPGVAAVADRIAVDPDGVEVQAYVIVTAGAAGSGDDFLATVEARIRGAEGLDGCLKGMEGRVVLELMVDESGITYRPGGTASPESLRCVLASVGEVVGLVQMPPTVKEASRTVTFGPTP